MNQTLGKLRLTGRLMRLARLVLTVATMLSAATAEAAEVAATKDVQIRSLYWTCPGLVPSATTMRFGYELSTWSQRHRGLLHFDLDASGVPAGATVMSARLVFYGDSQIGPNFEAGVYRLTTTDWSETATWTTANCDTPSSWTAQGGDYTATNGVTFTTSGSGFYNLDITGLAQDAVDSAGRQLHLLIKGPESAAEHEWLNIRSSEHADPATRPALLITWAVAGGEGTEIAPAADTELSFTWQTCPSGMGGSTLGDDPKMQLGFDDNGKLTDRARPLLRFDLTAGGVPSNAIVTSAALQFFAESKTGSDFSADVHRVTQPAWTETATWIDADCDSATDWTTDGGDYDATAAASFTTDGIGYYSLNLTDLVQDAITSQSGQLHFLMKAATESGSDHWIYGRTREHTNSYDRPVVSVAWVTPLPPGTPTPVEVDPSPDITEPPAPADPNSIELERRIYLRGKVRNAAGAPLPGVTVDILDHPEFGSAQTRATGLFDLAVNGGGRITVRFNKAGYVQAQRHVEVSWRDAARVPDVVMVAYATNVPVDLTDPGITVARGPIETDADGSRRATLLFQQGTHAQMRMPDGSTEAITNFPVHVSATEYTVGANGPDSMPAPLPPTSGYTYAVELSVDEAVAAGATHVEFDQPVFFYLENFLGFEVGEIVPSGYYDREAGLWVPSDNGQVIKILSIDQQTSEASLDSDGDPQNDPDNGAALGITTAERVKLGELYSAQQTLWRVPITHFTPYDFNWPMAPPPDSYPPDNEPPPDPPDDCTSGGSIIGCQSQTLGETLPIVGTPYTLNYKSDRVPGRRSDRTTTFQVSGPSVPASLTRIELEIHIAGRLFKQSFDPLPNQSTVFEWDGKDAYGQTVLGSRSVFARIGYVYDGVFYQRPRQAARAFALASGIPTLNLARREVTLWQEQSRMLGADDARQIGLGGWTINAHHVRDTVASRVRMGSRARKNAETLTLRGMPIVAAGNGSQLAYCSSCCQNPACEPNCYCGGGYTLCDGGGAACGSFGQPRFVRVGPDGSLFVVADVQRLRVAQTIPGQQRVMQTVTDDHWPAGVAAGNGSIYFSTSVLDGATKFHIYRDGVHIAGINPPGVWQDSGDGGPAISAELNRPGSMVVGPDGSLYVSTFGRVRRIDPGGTINTVAGSTTGYLGDGGPADAAKLNNDSAGIDIGPDGSIYIADKGNHRVRRVAPDGMITTVAGDGTMQPGGEGGPATLASVPFPADVAVAPDGSLYIAQLGIGSLSGGTLRHVSLDGVITTVASGMETLTSVDVGPDGLVYLAESGAGQIHTLLPPSGEIIRPDGTVLVASDSATEVYVFDQAGKHLRTLDALTGATLHEFEYDAADRLRFITDRDGNQTEIQHDASGNPTGIIAPGGQTTALTVDANGYLDTVANPALETYDFDYTNGGLMSAMRDPKTNLHLFEYDTLGRLVRDDDPTGGWKTLAREDTANGYSVTLATKSGRTQVHGVEQLADQSRHEFNISAAGLQTEVVTQDDGVRTVTHPDGTTVVQELGADPRWGSQAPVASRVTTTTPGGLQMTIEEEREVSKETYDEPMSLTQMLTTTRVNGDEFSSLYVAGDPSTVTTTTPEGRQAVSTYDDQGRVQRVDIPDLHPVVREYDSQGRIIAIKQGPDPSDPNDPELRVTSFTYKPLGDNQALLIDTVTDPEDRVSSFEYDDAGRVTTRTLPHGQAIAYTYDDNGNLISIAPPGRPVHEFDYTPVNLESEYSPPQSSPPIPDPRTLHTYNSDRQLDLITRPDGQTIDYQYDAGGRLQVVLVQPFNETYTYAYFPDDPVAPNDGQLQTIVGADATLTYDYDGSLLTSETWSGEINGTVTHTYGTGFNVTMLQVDEGTPISFNYDNDGQLIAAGGLTIDRTSATAQVSGTALGNVTDSWTYTPFGELGLYEARFGADPNEPPIYSVEYYRDKLGRITAKNETLDGITAVFEYDYDLAGRLWHVKKDGAPTSTYVYDANGNRAERIHESGTTFGTYDAQDRLLTYGDATYSYTGNGELSTKVDVAGTTGYAYDAFGNLRSVTLPDGTLIEYLVDGRGRRIGKKVDNVLVQQFLFKDQLNPVAELDGQGNLTSEFVYGTKTVPDYLIRHNDPVAGEMTTYRVVSDQLGSVRLLINVESGVVAQQKTYDEFGNATVDVGSPSFQPFGFAGGFDDSDTGLIRFGMRDYSPEIGRWTSKDPLGLKAGETNLFEYVLGDPVNSRDPTGLNGCGDTFRACINQATQERNDCARRALIVGTACIASCGPGCLLTVGPVAFTPCFLYCSGACTSATAYSILTACTVPYFARTTSCFLNLVDCFRLPGC